MTENLWECIYEIELAADGSQSSTLYVSRGVVVFGGGVNRTAVEGQRLAETLLNVGDVIPVQGFNGTNQSTECTIVSVRKISRNLTYRDWLAEVDLSAWEQWSERDYTNQTGANKPGDPWIEPYLDGATPEGAWREEIYSTGE